MTRFADSYAARMTIVDALIWLHEFDGWTWRDLRALCDDEIDTLIQDESDDA